MLIIGSILLLLANAVTLRREKSILFNRVAILILLYSATLGYDSLAIGSLDTGIGVFSGLFHSTAITHSMTLGYLFKVSYSRYSFTSQRVFPNYFSKQTYSTLANPIAKLNPYFVTGFVDGEGYFYIKICKENRAKLGWKARGVFGIVVHKKDQVILELIQTHFNGVGNISKHGKDAIQYQVGSLKDLALVINHFNKYPLLTKKKSWLWIV